MPPPGMTPETLKRIEELLEAKTAMFAEFTGRKLVRCPACDMLIAERLLAEHVRSYVDDAHRVAEGDGVLSAIDDWKRQRDKMGRLREDLDVLLSEKGLACLEIKTAGLFVQQHAELLAAVRSALSSPEGHRMLIAVADRAERAALDAAIDECRAFLEEHLAGSVMES